MMRFAHCEIKNIYCDFARPACHRWIFSYERFRLMYISWGPWTRIQQPYAHWQPIEIEAHST